MLAKNLKQYSTLLSTESYATWFSRLFLFTVICLKSEKNCVKNFGLILNNRQAIRLVQTAKPNPNYKVCLLYLVFT